MVDPGPLKALSDSSEREGSPGPSLEGEEFGRRLAYGLAVVIFIIFLIGSCKG